MCDTNLKLDNKDVIKKTVLSTTIPFSALPAGEVRRPQILQRMALHTAGRQALRTPAVKIPHYRIGLRKPE